MVQAEATSEQDSADEMLEDLLGEEGLSGESKEAKADKSQTEVATSETEPGSEIDKSDLDKEEGIPVSDAGSAEPELYEDDGLDGVQEFNEELLAGAGALGQKPVLASIDDPAQEGDSLMDELEPVDIDLPDAEAQLAETVIPEGDSLEDEWAKLLEEDADSAESLGEEVILQKNRAPGAP